MLDTWLSMCCCVFMRPRNNEDDILIHFLDMTRRRVPIINLSVYVTSPEMKVYSLIQKRTVATIIGATWSNCRCIWQVKTVVVLCLVMLAMLSLVLSQLSMHGNNRHKNPPKIASCLKHSPKYRSHSSCWHFKCTSKNYISVKTEEHIASIPIYVMIIPTYLYNNGIYLSKYDLNVIKCLKSDL